MLSVIRISLVDHEAVCTQSTHLEGHFLPCSLQKRYNDLGTPMNLICMMTVWASLSHRVWRTASDSTNSEHFPEHTLIFSLYRRPTIKALTEFTGMHSAILKHRTRVRLRKGRLP